MTAAAKRILRCAIYTRKSSEEGLDQAFNTLHAQREACEAYVSSQASEGWRVLPELYDDGGFSGGNLERPALKRLMDHIDAGRIDTVVVYKIDRLTRSLADFARIVDRLDAAGASFVSVTQAFNTTTSMGRLTLNVLLSFAQFEREVTGERIRDKIAQSKAKGMWMGGVSPLGYDAPTDPKTRALVVNEIQAATVRLLFETYLDLSSVHLLVRRLDADCIRSKAWVTRAGAPKGGARFSRGALFHLLQNRVYLGEIAHGKLRYPGSHPGIVDPELFERVRVRLSEQSRTRRERPTLVGTMPLRGLLFDIDGSPMCPSFSYGRGGRIHRYYVSAPLTQGRTTRPNPEAIRRIAAGSFEDMLRAGLNANLKMAEDAPLPSLITLIKRIEVEASEVRLTTVRSKLSRASLETCHPHESDAKLVVLTLPIRCRVRGGRTSITPPAGSGWQPAARRDPLLIRALGDAHRLVAAMGWRSSDGDHSDHLAKAPGPVYERMVCRLAFLAPDLQQLILDGRQPAGVNLKMLVRQPLPLCWAEQRRRFALAE